MDTHLRDLPRRHLLKTCLNRFVPNTGKALDDVGDHSADTGNDRTRIWALMEIFTSTDAAESEFSSEAEMDPKNALGSRFVECPPLET